MMQPSELYRRFPSVLTVEEVTSRMVIFGRVQVERDVKQTRGHVELSAGQVVRCLFRLHQRQTLWRIQKQKRK